MDAGDEEEKEDETTGQRRVVMPAEPESRGTASAGGRRRHHEKYVESLGVFVGCSLVPSEDGSRPTTKMLQYRVEV